MKLIPLTQGRFAKVDDEDFPFLARFRWHLHNGQYAATSANGSPVLMHRVLLLGTGQIDHVNGDGLDNQAENLRAATSQQNMRNKRNYKPRKDRRPDTPYSSFKGVSWHCSGKWRAAIRFGGRQRQLGVFATEELAARAYDKAAKEHFGPFARLNFPAPVAA